MPLDRATGCDWGTAVNLSREAGRERVMPDDNKSDLENMLWFLALVALVLGFLWLVGKAYREKVPPSPWLNDSQAVSTVRC
jgi:hypothetical protein